MIVKLFKNRAAKAQAKQDIAEAQEANDAQLASIRRETQGFSDAREDALQQLTSLQATLDKYPLANSIAHTSYSAKFVVYPRERAVGIARHCRLHIAEMINHIEALEIATMGRNFGMSMHRAIHHDQPFPDDYDTRLPFPTTINRALCTEFDRTGRQGIKTIVLRESVRITDTERVRGIALDVVDNLIATLEGADTEWESILQTEIAGARRQRALIDGSLDKQTGFYSRLDAETLNTRRYLAKADSGART